MDQSTTISNTHSTFKQIWIQKIQCFCENLLFWIWPLLTIYWIGIIYSLGEILRNLQIFGFKKLDYDKEFKGIDLQGKICVMTGGSRGIGLAVVKYLLSKNCIIITGTSSLSDDASEHTIKQYKMKLMANIAAANEKNEIKNLEDRIIVYPLNLYSMDSVAKFIDRIKNTINNSKIDFLICNGGVMFIPFKINEKYKFEGHMAINYYGHCLLIIKLLPLLAPNNNNSTDNSNRSRSRIIIVSSAAHHSSFGLRIHDFNSLNYWSPYHAYAQSKLALIMFTYKFDRWIRHIKLNGINLRDVITINSLHPGICSTSLIEGFYFARFKFIQNLWIFRKPDEGAETILFTALSRKVDNISGKYFEDCLPKKSSAISYDLSLQDQLWEITWNDLKPWLTDEELKLALSCKM